ncbi:hypothetical protein [Bacillus cereus]|uniref:Uncharacterized protein n=1 Tax=Bacillus cereus VD118 TaxID=1053231 RepID=R8QTS5_BACCE|nr:hypothetical protein [Bacillus cereus]EOP74187.1 hypothetical protein IIQ_05116 [Bacillus cereus VD118]
MGENEKLNKFEQLAEKRVSEVLKKMQLIGNLANRNNYDYTDKHVKQIIETLENELKMLKSKFGEKSLERRTTFKFKQ